MPCENPALRAVVRPSPQDALLEPGAPCAPLPGRWPPACTFGAPAAPGATAVALLGDSHASHWRPALAHVLRRRRWRGLSLWRSNCPFTFARRPPARGCAGWARAVVRRLRARPEVHVVVVSANSGAGVVPAPGRTARETGVDGYLRAWAALPRSVRHVVVLRDVPHNRHDTNACVADAHARGRDAGRRCARPRRHALGPDPQVEAAALAPRRVQVVDLSDATCDPERCFPVVGGALVIKDVGHLTRTFSATLGPLLARAMEGVCRTGC